MNTATNSIKLAVHQHRLFSLQGINQRLFSLWFNSFIYNQIWEDPRVDLEALEVNEQSHILTISSGGCNILNYLTANPARVVAVDLNPYHMSLTQLKLATLEHLPNHEMFYDFFGFGQHSDNKQRYEEFVAPHISEELDSFWSHKNWHGKARLDFFEDNFYHHTRFGFFVRLIHKIGRRAGCNPQAFLKAKSLEEQKELYEQHIAPVFSTKIVKLLSKLPLSVFSLGIPPQQYNAMKQEGNLIEQFEERIKRLSCDFPVQDNYFAWQAFSLAYDHQNRIAIPDYLKAENYEKLKSRLHRVESHTNSLIHYLEEQPDNSMDRFVFLDALDWMNDDVLESLWKEVARVGKPESRIIFRTAAETSPIETALSSKLRSRFTYKEQQSKEFYQKDRSAIYGGFHLYILDNAS